MPRGQKVGVGALVLLCVALAAFAGGVLVARPTSSEQKPVAQAAEPSTTLERERATTTETTTSTTTTTAAPTTAPPTTTTVPSTTTPPTVSLPPAPTVPPALEGWVATYSAMRTELAGTDVDPNSDDPCGPRLAVLDRYEPQLSPQPTAEIATPFTRYFSELRATYTACLAQENWIIEAHAAEARAAHAEVVGAVQAAGGAYVGP